MGLCPLLKRKKIWCFQFLHIRGNANIKRQQKHLKNGEGRSPTQLSPAEGVHGNRTKISLCFRGVMHQRWGGIWVRQLCKIHSPSLRYSPRAFVPAQKERGSICVCYWANESIARCLIQLTWQSLNWQATYFEIVLSSQFLLKGLNMLGGKKYIKKFSNLR